jgi:hypothetical protein
MWYIPQYLLHIILPTDYQAPNLRRASNSQLSKSEGTKVAMSNGSYMQFFVIKSADLSRGLLSSADV